MGRNPVPTALKILTGTAAHNPQRINKDEPHPRVGATPPPWLPKRGVAHAAWLRLEPILTRMRVLTEADAEALALGCMALAEYLDSPSEADNWRRADAAWTRYMKMLSSFGMTPAARAKVSTAVSESTDPLERWAAER